MKLHSVWCFEDTSAEIKMQIVEDKLKVLVFWVAIIALAGTPAVAWADSPESGFYLGGGGNLLWVAGTGTWSDYDFDVKQPLATEEGSTIGFAWTDKMLLGIKPLVGYKFNELVCLQVGYGMSIPKSSQQKISESNGLVYYEQGLNVEWEQRNLEVLGLFYPNTDLGYYFFGGFDMTWVDTKITLFENAEFPDANGNPIYDGATQIENDDIVSTGFILGVGLEFSSENRNTVVYVSGQYSRSVTNDTFFGTEDFKVDVGGLSFMVGIKWYPFSK